MSKRDFVSKALLCGGALYAGAQWLRTRRSIQFAGRVAVITGGSRGLGLVLARLLADEGAHLVLLSHDEAELNRAEAELSERGDTRVLTALCDVTDAGAVQEAMERAAQHFGGLDCAD